MLLGLRDFPGKFEGMTAVVKFTENNGCLYVFVYMWQTSVHNGLSSDHCFEPNADDAVAPFT